MMKPKVKPANQNLIDQEEEKPKVNLKKPSTSFADFNLLEMPRPKKEEKEKINKQQFMSMGGVPPLNRPKTKAPIDFDLFHHGIEKANLEGDKKQGNSSNLISFEND